MRYSLDKSFKLQVTTAKSKVKSRSHHDDAHIHPITYVPTNFLCFTVYEIQPRQDFQNQSHSGKVKDKNKVTPQCCTPTDYNECPYPVSTPAPYSS